MKNLNPFIDDTGIFLDDVINAKKYSKKDPDYKTRVDTLKPNVKAKYTTFDTENSANNLASLTAHGYKGQDKIDLLKLYKYGNAIFQKLKTDVTTIKGNRLINTCQNCTINEINSFDHIVPKDEFPEFSVNPKNLFPSCSKCNGHKNVVWREHHKSVFLNLYLDKLPNQQYLFCNPTIKGDAITLMFTIDNRNGVEQNLYDLIENHYNRLHLPKRFSKNSHDVIYELSSEINKYKDKMTKEKLIETIIEGVLDDKKYYGFNFWKSIIKETLINDTKYLALMFD